MSPNAKTAPRTTRRRLDAALRALARAAAAAPRGELPNDLALHTEAILSAFTEAAARALAQLGGVKAHGRIPAAVRAEVASVLLALRPLRTAPWCEARVALELDEVAESWQRSAADLRAAVIRFQKGECYAKQLVEHGGPPPGPNCTGKAKDVVFYATAARAAGAGGLGKVAFCRSCRLRHDAKARGVKAASTRAEQARARTGQIDLFAETR